MYTNNPFQPVQVRRIQEAPPPDPIGEFFSEYRVTYARPERRLPPATPGPWCVFNGGREVQRGANCPHYREPQDG